MHRIITSCPLIEGWHIASHSDGTYRTVGDNILYRVLMWDVLLYVLLLLANE